MEESGNIPRVGVRTTEGYACSTIAEHDNTRAFDPNNSLRDLEAGWRNVQGFDDSDIEEESGLPPAQLRKSLLDPTQPMTPIAGHHQSVRLSQSVDRPKHTNPKCNLCPGLPAGIHLCRERGE